MDDDVAKNTRPTFMNHMFKFDDETKHELSNIIQYVVLAIIPIVTLNKLMKKYIPDADDDKGSFEICFEILLQLFILLLALYYIHRLITFVPTYSGTEYPEMNLTSYLLLFLVIVLSLHSKLGEKINIIVDRIYDLWEGESKLDKNKKKPKTLKEVNQQQALIKQQEDQALQQQMQQTVSQIQQPQQQVSPNFNMFYQNNMENEAEPQLLAANEVLGGNMGTMF